MCRYAIHAYKQHYACFACRMAFKPQAADQNLTRCPNCGAPVYRMGLDFKAPKRTDTVAWKAVQMLYTGGVAFDSCGCNGPGYRPVNPKAVVPFLAEIQAERASEGARLLSKFNARIGR